MAIRDSILKKRMRVFTGRDLRELLSWSPRQALYYLSAGTKSGLFLQLKRGLYCLQTDPPSETEVANALYRPSYISFEYALAFYSILPDMVYTVTSATTRSTREFVIAQKSYQYTTIKVGAYTGYELKIFNNDERYLIADPEKALTDYLYAVSLGRRALSERLDVSRVNKKKVEAYASLFARDSLMRLVAKIFHKSYGKQIIS